VFRRATDDDSEQIASIWRAAWASANPGIATIEPMAHWLSRVEREFSGTKHVTVLESDGKIFAFYVIDVEAQYLEQMFVTPARQSAGTGKRIIQRVSAQFPYGWTLHVAQSNQRAQMLYARCGLVAGAMDVNPSSGRARVHYRWAPTNPV
jgi:putative acetyltransferase